MVFRRMTAMRPINRIKHVVDSQGAGVLGTQVNVDLIATVDAPVLANTTEVETASTVHGIYLHVEAYGTTAGALSNLYLMISKNPGNNIAMPDANVVGASDNKRFVIHQSMVMLQKEVAGIPRVVFDGVIKIPRGYKRNGPQDKLRIGLLSPGVNFDYCFQCHYKEFR